MSEDEYVDHDIAAITSKLAALEGRCTALEAENDRLRPPPADHITPNAPAGDVSRRGMLGSVAKVAAGVAALGAVGVLDARPAAATQGQPLIAGATNTASTGTGLTVAIYGAALGVTNDGDASNFGVGISASGLSAGISAKSEGTAVEGTTDTGRGVFGYSDSGTGVIAGSWTGTGLLSESAYATAIDALTQGNAYAVKARATSTSSSRACTYSQHSGPGPGVRGISARGVGGSFQGGRAALNLTPKATTGRPTSGAHTIGDVVLDSAGALYLCTHSGTPGTWVKVSVTPA